jgi:hypothetical protein
MNGDMGFGDFDMNAKQVIATGIVAAMLALGPTIASAQEGPYFGLFYGLNSIDVSKNELDATTSARVQALRGSAPSGTSDLNDSDIVWGAQIGYRFNRWVAAEVGYVDLGKANYVANVRSTFTGNPSIPNGTYDFQVRDRLLSSGPTIAVLGMLPLGSRFDIYGRGGIYFADTRLRSVVTVGPGFSVENKAGTQEFFGGFGGSWNINNDYALKVEATYFMDVGDDDRTGESSYTMLAVGFAFR